MRSQTFRASCRAIVCALVVWLPSFGPAGAIPAAPAAEAGATAGDCSLRFEENVGQTDAAVRFIARGSGYMLFLTDAEAVFALAEPRAEAPPSVTPDLGRPRPEPVDGRVIRMRLEEAYPEPAVSAGAELPGVSNYFLGDDPNAWRTGVRSFDSVRYDDVYPGVDLVFYGRGGALEYDFVVAPGADPRPIALAFDGAERVVVADDGSLVLSAGPCELRQAPPVVYQPAGDARETVTGRYVAGPDNTVRFELGAYDPSRALVIDPMFAYSTYLGGGLAEVPYDVTTDEWGNAYVVGYTTSPNFPRVGSPWTYEGIADAFVAVLGRAGMALVYSAYLGGTDSDFANAVRLDASGAVYLVGSTYSSNFPTVNPIETDAGNPDLDAFVAKIAPTGASLVYSTYLGGDDVDRAYGIAVDPAGNAYVAGETRSTDFPTVHPFQLNPGVGVDAFVSKLDPQGTALLYSTYLGGTNEEGAYDIAVAGGGEVVVVGQTSSSDFPRLNPYQNLLGGGYDVFVTKLAASGSALRYSTFVGGRDVDTARDLALDADGAPVVVGDTFSTDFPTAHPMFAEPGDGNFDAFVFKLSQPGNTMRFSTYLCGGQADTAYGVAVAADGRIHVAGSTSSADYPLANQLQNNTDGLGYDAFVTCLAPTGTALVYSTYLGGGAMDLAQAVAVDGSGNDYVVGITMSPDFPMVNPYQGTIHGEMGDCFVTKIGNATADLLVQLTAVPEPVTTGQQLTYTLTVGNAGPNAAGEVIAAVRVPMGTRSVGHEVSQGRFVPPTAVGIGYFYVGRLAQGTAATLRLDVVVDAAAGSVIENSATVITTAADPAAANNGMSTVTHVVSEVVPPEIANVESMVVAGKPYRIRITGTNFQVGVVVYIAIDTEPWPTVKRKSETTLILKGAGLKARFPRGVPVPIRVVNPDTGADSTTFAR